MSTHVSICCCVPVCSFTEIRRWILYYSLCVRSRDWRTNLKSYSPVTGLSEHKHTHFCKLTANTQRSDVHVDENPFCFLSEHPHIWLLQKPTGLVVDRPCLVRVWDKKCFLWGEEMIRDMVPRKQQLEGKRKPTAISCVKVTHCIDLSIH